MSLALKGGADKRHVSPLTRERILEATMALIDREGLEGLSMRRLGSELGVEAMALYYYFRSKSALVDGLCEKVLSELDLETDSVREWSERLRRGLTSFRNVLRRHPNLVPLMTSRPVLTAAALRATEQQYAALRSGGLGPKAVIDAHRTLGSYVFGYLLVETQFARSGLSESDFNPDLSFLTPEAFPATFELMPFQAASGWDEQFQIGLDLILAGIEAMAGDRRPPRRATRALRPGRLTRNERSPAR